MNTRNPNLGEKSKRLSNVVRHTQVSPAPEGKEGRAVMRAAAKGPHTQRPCGQKHRQWCPDAVSTSACFGHSHGTRVDGGEFQDGAWNSSLHPITTDTTLSPASGPKEGLLPTVQTDTLLAPDLAIKRPLLWTAHLEALRVSKTWKQARPGDGVGGGDLRQNSCHLWDLREQLRFPLQAEAEVN